MYTIQMGGGELRIKATKQTATIDAVSSRFAMAQAVNLVANKTQLLALAATLKVVATGMENPRR